MTLLRHEDPNFTGFKSDGASCFFYVRGREYAYWQLDPIDDAEGLVDTMIAFYTQGVEAARKRIDGDVYVPPEARPARRFRLVHETACDDDTGEPLAWNNGMGWVDLESATLFTEEEALGAQLLGEKFRIEEVFP